MSTSSNKHHVTQMWSELEQSQDLAVLDRYFDPDYVRHVGPGRQTLSEWKLTLGALYAAFPDLVTDVKIAVAEDDWVSYKWISHGTHSATYFGVPPTGKAIHATGITLNRFERGRIIEEHSSWNKVDVLHTLGILPISELA
ncbi:MAG: ester cyclase [Aeromicrobium sp.]